MDETESGSGWGGTLAGILGDVSKAWASVEIADSQARAASNRTVTPYMLNEQGQIITVPTAAAKSGGSNAALIAVGLGALVLLAVVLVKK